RTIARLVWGSQGKEVCGADFSSAVTSSTTGRIMLDLSSRTSTIARAARAVAVLSLTAAMALASSVAAFAQSVPIVRDAEIEALVRDYARPIFKAAGLSN